MFSQQYTGYYMKQQVKIKQNIWRKTVKKFTLYCELQMNSSLLVEITKQKEEAIYFATISNDTIPENIKLLFPDPINLFEFLVEDSDSGSISIPSIDKLVLLIKVGKNIREFTIHLTQKLLTQEDKLRRKISELQKQLKDSKKQYSNQLLQMRLQQSTIQNLELKEKIRAIEAENVKLKEQRYQKQASVELINDLKKKNSSAQILDKQLTQALKIVKEHQSKINILQEKNTQLQNELATLNFLLSQKQKQISDSREVVDVITKAGGFVQQNELGKPLIFKPLQTSNNYKCYTFNNKILIKNNLSFTGTGRLLPAGIPIPKQGRHYLKLKHKHSAGLPNFRIGVIARKNLESQTYINGGDLDAVMYYCYSTEKQIIYEGLLKVQGFTIPKGSIFSITVDQSKKKVEWRLQGILKNVSNFTESMKKSDSLYFFVQLWNNGDSLQMFDS